MAVQDIFSKRAQRSSGQTPDVFVYDEMPLELRVQIVHIVRDVMGDLFMDDGLVGEQYEDIHSRLAREYGRFHLSQSLGSGQKVIDFILKGAAPAQVMDVVELVMTKGAGFSKAYRQIAGCKLTVREAAEELNTRCMEHGVGYQFQDGHIIRIDSRFVHGEIVKPALQLLSDPAYQGPQDEFLNAHKHYREGKHKECIADCLKAFESTMKAVCDKRGWAYNKTDTANALIQVCVQNNLIDPMLLSHVGALRTVLEAGVPTVRNRLAGHGQGAAPVTVPTHYAAYALHLTAANILFLVNSEKALP